MTQTEWLVLLYQWAVSLGLPTTSWRSGDPERVFLTLISFLAQRQDALASAYNQGGFLDFAATGTVTLEGPDGTSVVMAVSPDPSDPTANPNGDVTLLDRLCSQNYATDRILSTAAGGAEAILNTSASTYGPFAAGGFHVTNPATRAGYTNTASLTIAPSTTVGTAVTNAQNSSGLIKITTSTAHGRSTGDVVWIAGVTGTTEANGPWYVTVLTTTTLTLQGSAFSNAYVSGGVVYLPTLTTVTADVEGSASSSYDSLGVVALHTVTTSVTSLIGVSVSNVDLFIGTDIEDNVSLAARAKLKLQAVTTNGAAGAYQFYALSATKYAPLLPPPQAVSTPITRVAVKEDLVSAPPTVHAWIANAAGAPSGSDVTAVDAVLQVYARPLGITLVTGAATEISVTVAVTIWIRSQFATTTTQAAFITALQTYFRLLPIGGYTDPGGAYTSKLVWSDVLGVIYETARTNAWTLDKVTLLLNGGTSDITLTVSTAEGDVAVISGTPSVTLNPV